jgi:hypothetical protein
MLALLTIKNDRFLSTEKFGVAAGGKSPHRPTVLQTVWSIAALRTETQTVAQYNLYRSEITINGYIKNENSQNRRQKRMVFL